MIILHCTTVLLTQGTFCIEGNRLIAQAKGNQPYTDLCFGHYCIGYVQRTLKGIGECAFG